MYKSCKEEVQEETFMNNNLQKRGNGFALIPFLVFIVIYLGAGLVLQAQGEEMAFYQFPSVTAMFIALIVAFCMGKESINQKFSIFAKGAANDECIGHAIKLLKQIPDQKRDGK